MAMQIGFGPCLPPSWAIRPPCCWTGLFQRGGRADDLGALPGGHCVPALLGALPTGTRNSPQAYRLPCPCPLPWGERLVLARPGHGWGDRPGGAVIGGLEVSSYPSWTPWPSSSSTTASPSATVWAGDWAPGLRPDLCVPGLPGGALRGRARCSPMWCWSRRRSPQATYPPYRGRPRARDAEGPRPQSALALLRSNPSLP